MALIKNAYRPFSRRRDDIMFSLKMEEWPKDVPLPEKCEQATIGDGPLPPSWTIYLLPDKTVEMVLGWFKVKRPLEEVFAWYQMEMEKRGWTEEEQYSTFPNWAKLLYRHPETNVKVEVSLRWYSYLEETRPMIRRATIHPWAPPEDEEAREAEGEVTPAAEASEPEAASLPVEELAPAG